MVRVFIYRTLPLLCRGKESRCTMHRLRFVRSAYLMHSILGWAIPFLTYLKDAHNIFGMITLWYIDILIDARNIYE